MTFDGLIFRVAKHPFMPKLFAEVRQDSDILLQLNALELIGDLGESGHGLQYLEDSNMLRDLDAMIESTCSSPMADILVPGFIKLFGSIARQHREDCLDKYPKFQNVMLLMMQVRGIQLIKYILD